MSEKVEVYDLDSKLIGIEDRDKFYSEIKKEFKEKGKISKKIKSVRLILMNSSGRIYLQKRSKIKNENAGLYDKTVGGHVMTENSFEMTVVRECAEELGVPAAILSAGDFERAIKVTDLNIVGIFKKVDYLDNFISERIIENSKKIAQPYITSIYIGYYDGSIKFVDGESSGIEVFSLDELRRDIQESPDKFTEDIKFMIEKYKKFLVPVE